MSARSASVSAVSAPGDFLERVGVVGSHTATRRLATSSSIGEWAKRTRARSLWASTISIKRDRGQT
jgi:hypothetical protein